jgi:hypothetical protein
MAPTAIEPARTHIHCAHLAAAIRAAYREVTALATVLSRADAELWVAVDPVLAELTAQADAMTAALTGTPPPTPAPDLPPAARLGDLVAAQQRLDAALDAVGSRPPGPLVVAARQSVDRVAALSGWLGALAAALASAQSA